jgi:hypothetical protein
MTVDEVLNEGQSKRKCDIETRKGGERIKYIEAVLVVDHDDSTT